jgi:hypothetical protein
MRTRVLIATGAVTALAGLSAQSAMAEPPDPASDPFVCPVLKVSGQAADNNDHFMPIGAGEYTILPGNAGSQATFNGNVPNNATNADGDGSVGEDHVSPGDDGYSAIWSGNP